MTDYVKDELGPLRPFFLLLRRSVAQAVDQHVHHLPCIAGFLPIRSTA